MTAIPYRRADEEAIENSKAIMLRLKQIPWAQVVVDVALLAAMAVVSSKLFHP